MSAWNQQPSPSLAEWLNIATEKLSLPGKERITLEINSHFQEALESSLADGLSEADAQAKALADLGDARSAARRFQTEHLTAFDVKRIKRKLRSNSGWGRRLDFFSTLFIGAALVIVGFYPFEPQHGARVPSLIMGGIFLSLAPAYYFLTNPKKLRAKVSAVSLTAFMLEFARASAICYMFGLNWVGMVGWNVILLVRLCETPREIRLWLKLRRMADVWQEMPPSAEN